MSENKQLIAKDHGEPSPEYMKNGPKEERGCTDILACILFVLFFFGTIGIGFWAFSKGDPWKVIIINKTYFIILKYASYFIYIKISDLD